jgi:hypothetical protein
MLQNGKVIDCELKKPALHPEITRCPYGYHKWRKATIAHRRCLKFAQLMQKTTSVESSTKKSKLVINFDTASYDIMDDC